MRQRELVQKIDLAFEEAGQSNDWIHRNFKNLYELNQLAHFQIFDTNWFNGAARILELVDQLHSYQTSKEDFLEIAEMLGISMKSRISKKDLVQQIKSNKSWRLKAFELESKKKRDQQKLRMKPLYLHLESLGYHTDSLPRQVSMRRWMVDAINSNGTTETLYLNESENGESVFIQSNQKDFVDLYKMPINLFTQQV